MTPHPMDIFPIAAMVGFDRPIRPPQPDFLASAPPKGAAQKRIRNRKELAVIDNADRTVFAN